jgi:MFS family permease
VTQVDHVSAALASRRRIFSLYLVEALIGTGSVFLTIGIFFFTEYRFGWGVQRNFLLAAAQGAVYVVGALLAGTLTRRWGRRRLLIALYIVLAAIACAGAVRPVPAVVTTSLMVYMIVIAVTWPALESMVCSGTDAVTMSRRLALYNLIWSGVGALAAAANGTIIEHWPAGVFLIPVATHAASAVILKYGVAPSRRGGGQSATDVPAEADAHPAAEQELLAQRRLALWLSRLALPATYTMLYSLAALMPMLPAMRGLDTSVKTVVGSTWMVSRWIVFCLLGLTTAWHTRPRLLLWAACLMLLAFLGTTIRPSDLLPQLNISPAINLLSMIFWQILLGAALGMIYSASLYFGMVLSEGSTEHGGYHEALIGLGSVLGPGTGALALWLSDGNVWAGIAAVAGIIALSILAAVIASVRLSRSG